MSVGGKGISSPFIVQTVCFARKNISAKVFGYFLFALFKGEVKGDASVLFGNDV